MGNFIYGLLSTKDNKIRYVGKTKKTLKERLYYHIYGALKRNKKTYKDNWIRKVYNDGFEIQIIEIEKCNENNINEREVYWINFYKTSNNLTNQLPGGDSGGVGGKIINFLAYDDAKKLINELSETYDIKSISKYRKFLNTHCEYKSILPKYPNDVYKFRGTWVDWYDYLSSTTTRPNKYIKLEKLKEIINIEKIKTKTDYYELVKRKRKEGIIIPVHPERAYKDNGWVSFKDILYHDNYYTLKELKLYLKPYKFRNVTDCLNFLKIVDNKKIPQKIEAYYKQNGVWRGWNDILNLKKFCSEEVFIRYIKFYHLENKIKTNADWYIFMEKYKPSVRICYRPDLQYKKLLSEFFVNIPKIKGKLEYKDFCEYCVNNVDEVYFKTHHSFHDYVKNNNLRHIPVYPSMFYKKKFTEIRDEILFAKKTLKQ